MTDNDLSPRERRYLKTRQSILDAALHIIREEGAENLSMRGIADKIDYSAGALYKYFNGKEALLGEICGEGFERLAHNMAAAIQPDMPITEQLQTTGVEYVRFAQQNPEVFRMMFDSVDSMPPDDSAQSLLQDSAFGLLNSIISKGVAQGVFSERVGFSVQHMTFQCWYLVHGMAMLRLTMFNHMQDDFDTLNTDVIRANVRLLAQTW